MSFGTNSGVKFRKDADTRGRRGRFKLGVCTDSKRVLIISLFFFWFECMLAFIISESPFAMNILPGTK